MSISLMELKTAAYMLEDEADAIMACVKAIGEERREIFVELVEKGVIPNDIDEFDDEALVEAAMSRISRYRQMAEVIAEMEAAKASVLYSHDDAISKFREIISRGADPIARRIIDLSEYDLLAELMTHRSRQIILDGESYFIFQGE